MISLSIVENYQRKINGYIKRNFEVTELCRDIDEVNSKIKRLNTDLKKMNIMDAKCNPNKKVIKFFKPGKIGLFIRTIEIKRYNPPIKEEEKEFSFI